MPVETKTEYDRICEAYLRMAREAKYRPAAPSDGFGNIQLSKSELEDEYRLAKEAGKYANQFLKEENEHSFYFGRSNWPTNRAFVYAIQGARRLLQRLRRSACDKAV